MAPVPPAGDVEKLAAEFARDGYAVLSGVWSAAELDELQAQMEGLQRRAAAGDLAARHAGEVFLAPFEGDRPPYVHYVNAVTDISAAAHAAMNHPVVLDLVRRLLGDNAYFWDYNGHGAVYQDARPGEGMTYTRIGWHSDHQSRPTSDIWPGVAVTVHLDATSPANGFLRVVPGSHLGGTEAMPLGFEKVPGEVGVYCERGDVMFHHSDLWHSAARATEDPPLGVRRHLRGTFLGGRRLGADEELEPFNKNAAR
jgi:ectoine hydroxylase-related dioxygenase (phytanoyl-CoA dioxygenase family)